MDKWRYQRRPGAPNAEKREEREDRVAIRSGIWDNRGQRLLLIAQRPLLGLAHSSPTDHCDHCDQTLRTAATAECFCLKPGKEQVQYACHRRASLVFRW